MSILNYINDEYRDAVVSSCAEKGCTLRLNDLDDYVIVKGERICKDRKICDHLIFIEKNLIIVIVEFKSRNAKPREIKEKMINCSFAALDILEECSESTSNWDFYHLVIVRNWRPHEYRKTADMNLTIRGKSILSCLGQKRFFFLVS